MPAVSETPVFVFGENFVFSKVSYSGQSTTFQVDQRASSVAVVSPASGPSASLANSVENDGLKTVTLAAGGQNAGGSVIVCTAYGKARAGAKPS